MYFYIAVYESTTVTCFFLIPPFREDGPKHPNYEQFAQKKCLILTGQKSTW